MKIGKKCSISDFGKLVRLDTPSFNPHRQTKACFKIRNIFKTARIPKARVISIGKAIKLQNKL